jgi:hypothetical protein
LFNAIFDKQESVGQQISFLHQEFIYLCVVFEGIGCSCSSLGCQIIAGYFATYSRKNYSDSALCSNISCHPAMGSLDIFDHLQSLETNY